VSWAIAVFVLCCFTILYVLVLYPLLVIVWARLRPRPVCKNSRYRPSVSVIMPVRNGEAWIEAKLSTLAALDYPKGSLEVIVVSDGSTDRTVELAQRSAGQLDLKILTLAAGGKPTALNAGIAQASGEVLFLTDVRQTLDPQALVHLVDCLGDPEVGVVSGELVIRSGSTHEEADIGLYWRIEKVIRKHVSLAGSFPGATGAIYAMRRELASPVPAAAFLDDVFLPITAYFKGKRIYWEPLAKAYDFPTSLDAEFRRKVRTLAGVYQMAGYYPRLLAPTHALAFHFISHKLGRLLLPYALIGAAVSGFFLPQPFAFLTGAGLALIALLALLDALVPAGFPLKRLSSPIRTFLVLMAAAFCAGFALFVPGGQVWTTTRVRTTGAGRT
jgi:poly-beta-1,6-N-acetyl-D-glucosamine synthase